MGTMTCEEYVNAVISNQTNVNEFRVDYRDGMSVRDLESCGLFDIVVSVAYGEVHENGEVINLNDFFENCQTKYEI